jgi:hypothetical protein
VFDHGKLARSEMALLKKSTRIKVGGIGFPTPSGRQWVFIVYLIFMVAVFIDFAVDEHRFGEMTPAQHLSEAKARENGKESEVADGLRHIAGIPANAPQFAEAKTIEANLRPRRLRPTMQFGKLNRRELRKHPR